MSFSIREQPSSKIRALLYSLGAEKLKPKAFNNKFNVQFTLEKLILKQKFSVENSKLC